MSRTSCFPWHLAGLMAIVAAITAPTFGQAGSQPAGSPPAAEGGGASPSSAEGGGATADQKLFSIDFPGGTAAAYIDAIRRESPDINIVAMPDVRLLSMPPLQLSSVSPAAALQLLNGRKERTSDAIVTLHVRQISSGYGEEIATFTVEAAVHDAAPVQGIGVAVWSIADVVSEERKAEDILTAVEAALEVLGDGGIDPEVKYHDATRLLIIRGTADQRNVVHEVLGQLRKTSTSQPATDEAALRNALDACQREKSALEPNLIQLRKTNDTLQESLNTFQESLKLRENELAARHQQLMRLQAELDELRARDDR